MMIRAWLGIAIATIFFIVPSARADRICSVHDGDTITTCSGRKVRLYGVDAPELKQPLGKASRDYLRGMVMGKEVQLKCAGKSYKRSVCRVYIGGQYVQPMLVSRGMAYDSVKYSHGEFAKQEATARAARTGVWAQQGGGVRPWDFRRQKKRK